MQWSKPTQFSLEANVPQKIKEEGTVQEFVIDNRGPGIVFFSAFDDVAEFRGQRLPVRAVWIEDTCPHEGTLYAISATDDTIVIFKAKI